MNMVDILLYRHGDIDTNVQASTISSSAVFREYHAAMKDSLAMRATTGPPDKLPKDLDTHQPLNDTEPTRIMSIDRVVKSSFLDLRTSKAAYRTYCMEAKILTFLDPAFQTYIANDEFVNLRLLFESRNF